MDIILSYNSGLSLPVDSLDIENLDVQCRKCFLHVMRVCELIENICSIITQGE